MGALDRRIGSGCHEFHHECRDETPFFDRTRPSGTVVPIGWRVGTFRLLHRQAQAVSDGWVRRATRRREWENGDSHRPAAVFAAQRRAVLGRWQAHA